MYVSTCARLEKTYGDIADWLYIPVRSDSIANVLQMVSGWLQVKVNGRWVMVLDNVDDVEIFRHRTAGGTIAPHQPESRNGSILVTSRAKDAATRLVGGYNTIAEVLAMD